MGEEVANVHAEGRGGEIQNTLCDPSLCTYGIIGEDEEGGTMLEAYKGG
jgi:hypothetical protein